MDSIASVFTHRTYVTKGLKAAAKSMFKSRVTLPPARKGRKQHKAGASLLPLAAQEETHSGGGSGGTIAAVWSHSDAAQGSAAAGAAPNAPPPPAYEDSLRCQPVLQRGAGSS
jgi:hypothetical protein